MAKDFFKDIDLSLLDNPSVIKQLRKERGLNALLKKQGATARRASTLKKLSPILIGTLVGILYAASKENKFKSAYSKSLKRIEQRYQKQSFSRLMKSFK